MAAGYNLYYGPHSLANVDFDTALESYASSATSGTATVELAPSTTYYFVLRPQNAADLETPDYSCVATLRTDSLGEWVLNAPADVIDAKAIIMSGGVVRVRWRYATGTTAAATFKLWYATNESPGSGDPNASVTYDRDRVYFYDFTLSEVPYWFKITARTDETAVDSPGVTIGPFIPDATAPDAPTITTSVRF